MLVANWICSYVLNDMLAIHQKGTRMMSTSATSPAVATGVARRRRGRARSVAITEQVAADEGDARDQQRHAEDRDGHPARPPQRVEGDLVGEGGKHLGGGAGSAARHHVDDVEVVDGPDER